MSQPNFLRIKISTKIALFAFVLIALSSCAEHVYNPYTGDAESIAVFSDGYILEMSKASGSARIFSLSGNPDKPQGHGTKVSVDIERGEFDALEYDLRLLEIRAFKEGEIIDRMVEEDTMGFDCSYRTSHSKSLFVIWRYQNGAERYALYYLGCHNSVSEMLRSSYFGRFDRLKSSVVEEYWEEAVLKDDGSVE